MKSIYTPFLHISLIAEVQFTHLNVKSRLSVHADVKLTTVQKYRRNKTLIKYPQI